MDDFRTYWLALTAEDRAALATRAGSSPGYLSLIAGGHKKCSLGIALAIERATDGQIRAERLCPDPGKPGLWEYAHERASALPHPRELSSM